MSENPVVKKLWKEEKQRKEFLYFQVHKGQKLNKNEKFCSFLKNSLLPKSSQYKFPYVLHNDKWEFLKFKLPQPKPKPFYINWLTHNEIVTIVLTTIFFIFYFSILYYDEGDILELDNVSREPLSLFLFNFSIFYYFLNDILCLLYVYNVDLKYLLYSYTLDLNYNNSYLLLFNFYIFSYSLIFFVFLNLGLIIYEHDKASTPPKKWDEIVKMALDFFDYTEFTDFNISNDSLLSYQDNVFNSLCIYEFHLDIMLYFFNIFDLSFFHKTTFPKKDLNESINIKYIYKPRSYLSQVSYNEILNNRKERFYEFFSKKYDEFSLSLLDKFFDDIDYYKYIMDIRSFKVKIPYLFFLLYTWYSIYYRNFRYNLYIRSYYFFEEYTCKKKIFILHNNPYGKNKTKISLFYYQRLWTIDYFKFYIEERFFNKWFLFYSTRNYYLRNFETNENLVNLYSFRNILNNFGLNLLLKMNEFNNFDKFEYIYEFYYDNMLDILDMNRSIDGFKLVMRTRITKFAREFKLGRSSFLEFDEFIEMMYTLPFDIYLYYKHFNNYFFFDFILELFNMKFSNFYFLKDFYNFYNKIDHIKSYKIVNLYNKLKYLSFYIADPYFFKYFWRKFFPRRLKRLRRASDYFRRYLIQGGIRRNTRLKILKYDYFHHYLNWRTDTSTSVQQNKYYLDLYSSSLSIVNNIVKSRYLNLLYKLKYILNFNNIFSIFKFKNLILLFKVYYLILLNQNIDIILYSFFFNKIKFLNIQNNYSMWLNMVPIIDNNLMYRYYVYFFLFEFDYYKDWFENRAKRVLWIFHKKDYREHEGALFYKKKFNEMF